MASSPRPSKAPSIASSAGTAKSASLPFLPRYTPKPEPAYISPAAAADFVLHNRSDGSDQLSPPASPTNETAAFSEKSLHLLNAFLDSLLYNFLAKAKGTSLNQLRPAITEVLKAKLARDALASADEELEGLVGEADLDDEEDVTTFGGQEGWSQEWHLEMAFKRMRLRVMVFIRLGDFDDEDEERFLEEEDENEAPNGEAPDQEDLLASPAAVYLAGVLEYIAERALSITGEAAFKRTSGKTHRRASSDESMENGMVKPLIVQDMDVEKMALNPTLGRLWRTWKKNYRTMHPGSPGYGNLSIPPSPTDRSFRGRLGSLNETIAAIPPAARVDREVRADRHLSTDEIPEGDVSEHDIAANIPLPTSETDIEEIETMELPDEEIVAAIPLPMGDNDVNEIEVPGLAKEIRDDDEEAIEALDEPRQQRPLSAILSWLTPFSWAPEEKPARPQLQRLRSSSMPSRDRPLAANFMGAEVFTPPVEKTEDEATAVPIDEVVTEPEVDSQAAAEPPAQAAPSEEQPVEAAAAPVAVPVEEKTPETVEEAIAEPTEEPVAKPETTDDAAIPASSPKAETVEKAESPIEEKEDSKTGLIAGTVAGATAIVGGAIAMVAGSKKDEEPETEKSIGEENLQRGKPPKIEVGQAEAEKPKSTVSSSIADRRRMFESQASSKAASSVSREVSPAPSEAPKSPAIAAPPERQSSLGAKSAVAAGATAAGVAAAAAALTSTEKVEDEPPALPAKNENRMEEKPLPSAPVQEEHDDKAIGVARTSDVPIQHARAAHSVSPPPEGQRSYHLPGTQSPRWTGPGRNVVLAADGEPVQSPPAETQQNGVKFAQTAPSEEQPVKKRPPPLMSAALRDTTEPTESSIRPTSRSATSTPPGHSTKNSASSSVRPLDKKSIEEHRQRDFDSLLKNNEPVKYTLTPEDLRTTETRSTTVTRGSALADMGPPSPRIISSPTTYTAKRSPPRESTSTRRETPSPIERAGSPKRKVGVPRVSQYIREAAHLRSLNSKPEPMNTNARRSGFMPREPRVVTDNTADLADYMQSTAPTAEQPVLPLVQSSSASKLNGNRTSEPMPRSPSRNKLIPREPEIKKDGTSELIDFIRQGPPGSKREQKRTVAPFRTTMDSDDLANLGDFSSFNSSGASNRQSGSTATGNRNSTAQQPALSAGPPAIVKKQRRVKDPYAIDSDDDEDYLTSLPGGRAVQAPQEESLADFLRNSEPPTGNSPSLLNGSSNGGSYLNGNPSARPGSRSVNAGGVYSASPAPSGRSDILGSNMGGPVSKPKFEARAAGATRNGFGGNGFYYSTNDMADFLRSSGPVDNMVSSREPPPLQKKPSKRGRLFNRKSFTEMT